MPIRLRPRGALPLSLTTLLLAGFTLAAPAIGVGPEVGPNDHRISAAGGVGNASFGAFFATAAVNADAGEVLVCWEGEDDVELAVNEREIFCQRLAFASGAEIGDDFRISDMGGLGDPTFHAHDPHVVYNSVDDLYLVVWSGSDDTGPLVASELEIFGQLLVGSDATEVGANDFRISDMGPDGDFTNWARQPAAAFDATQDEFLVCWEGVDTAPASSEQEIFCQRLVGATGTETGLNDFRISSMGPPGSSFFEAQEPAVTWAETVDEYLVVWWGDDDTPPLVNGEDEIYGQRLSGSTGAEIGADDFRLSDMGPDGNAAFDAQHPTVAFSPAAGEYLVCWDGDDDAGGAVEDEEEIFCQRIQAQNGAEVGTNDFRVSSMGPAGDPSFDATRPWVDHSALTGSYLVTWYGDSDLAGLADDELEVFGQAIFAADGALARADEFRLSDMGPDGDWFFHALSPVVVATPAGAGEFLVAWHGTDDIGGVAPSEHEIYVQRLRADFLFWDGFESQDTSAWSSTQP